MRLSGVATPDKRMDQTRSTAWIEVQGVTYEVRIPAFAAEWIASVRDLPDTQIFTYYHVSERSPQPLIIGFPDLAARLIGTKLEDEVVQAVVNDAATAFDPGGDLHASPEYRRQLATVLATRMLRAAYDGARKAS